MTKLFQTRTSVHDPASSLAQRQAARGQSYQLMLGLVITGQLMSFGALYLLPAAATSAWIAVLLQAVPFLAMRLLGRWLAATAPEDAAATPRYRVAAGGMALLFFSNMNVSLLSLVELTHVFFFPGAARWLLALPAALALGLGIPSSPDAVPNTARLLRWFLAAAFLFCAVTVVPTGETGFLYPIWGYGPRHTLRCALRAAGSVWAAGALAVVMPREPDRPPMKGAIPGLTCIGLVALFFLCCAFVLPGSELSARWGYAPRLQLLMEMSPNTLSWSLMLMAEMLLFLTAFSVCADMLRRSLCLAFRARRLPLLPFTLACVPLALRGMGESERLLLAVLPWRLPLAVGLMGLCLVGNLRRKGKTS